jgi:hypothetical protein
MVHILKHVTCFPADHFDSNEAPESRTHFLSRAFQENIALLPVSYSDRAWRHYFSRAQPVVYIFQRVTLLPLQMVHIFKRVT